MKLRDPRLIRAASAVGATLIRAWMSTISYRHCSLGPTLWPTHRPRPERVIYTFWHESILGPAYPFGRPDISVLISQSPDGELIAGVSRRLGYRTVAGSSSRGGVGALRAMLTAAEAGHLVFTPDGPRGPRRVVQSGVAYAAAKSGLPVAPLGVGFSAAWRAASWDRFAVPKPFCRVHFVTGEPVRLPPDTSAAAVERGRLRVQAALDDVQALAEAWADTGVRPARAAEPAQARRAA